MLILKDTIEEIKSKIDIVELISRYVSLQKVGNSYRGLCPFHTETTPSFYVNPSFKTYHCFGCGASGDVIKFVQEIEGIPFMEALKKLADEAGVKIEYSSSNSFQQLYFNFYKELHKEYIEKLFDEKIALDYLFSRGFNEEEIKEYEFGFSPINSKIPQKIAQKLDIKSLKKFGFSTHDQFEGRLIIPIKNEYSNVIAFGGRLLGEGQPKYLNSYETDFFKKSKTLFLLDIAKDKIKTADFAIICEGYFDAIAFHRADFKNAVATLGTAFTKFHAFSIKKLTQNVILAFDTDSAGVKAALQSIKILISMQFNVMVAGKTKEKDPDEIYKTQGSSGLYSFLKEAIPAEEFIPYVLSKNYDLNNSNAIPLYTREIKNWEKTFENFPEKLQTFRKTAEKISKTSITVSVPKPKQKTNLPTLDEMVIYLLLNNPQVDIEINPKIFNELTQEFIKSLKNLKNFSFEKLSKDLQKYIENILNKMEKFEINEDYINTVKKKIEEKTLEKRIEEIDKYLNSATEEEKRVLLQTRMELVRKLKKLGR